jgi:hypothetical protein
MRPVEAPPAWRNHVRAHATPTNFGPPPGYDTSEVGDCPALLDHTKFGPAIRIVLEPDEEERKMLASGEYLIELTIWGHELRPFGLEVYDKAERYAPAEGGA